MHNGIFFFFSFSIQNVFVARVSPNTLVIFSFAFLSVFLFLFLFFSLSYYCGLDFFLEMLFCFSFFLVGCVGVCVCVLRRNLNRVVCIYISKSDTFMFYTMLCMYLGGCFMILYRLSLVNYGKNMNHG